MNSHHTSVQQSGFTLMELLIALALTLVIVVAVQRYVAGVRMDQDHLTTQQDQTSQTFIVLSNIQRDVARAGYMPVASRTTQIQEAVSVKTQTCTIEDCVGDELLIQYWQYAPSTTNVYDCVGDKVTERSGDWARVENIYRVDSSSELLCSGNGGTSSRNLTMLDSVFSHSWKVSGDSANNRLLHLCLTFTVGNHEQVAGAHQPKDCISGADLDSKSYRTTELDLLVRPQQTGLLTQTVQGAAQ